MYHRFDENKYPSTNIQLIDFIAQIKMIEKMNLGFVDPDNFNEILTNQKGKRKVLITIDDAFLSFYKNAWPILKEKKIPFILFVSTKEIGNKGYMNWAQIKEVAEEELSHIGNHSHSHGYLVDEKIDFIKSDILKSISQFEKVLGKNSTFFSYPFGEYSSEFINLIQELNFKYAFGQHSGVIDETKNFFALPRFPINEKYGKLKRFKTLLKTLPLKYKSILPAQRYIYAANNPPKVEIEFFEDIRLKSINCFSNEENKWRSSQIKKVGTNKLEIILEGKFTTERGRINCSLKEDGGFYRWLGMQFVVAEK